MTLALRALVSVALTGLALSLACSAGESNPNLPEDGSGGASSGTGGGGGIGVGAGSGLGGIEGGDNALGIPTNVILKPQCDADCPGFSDPDDPTQPWVVVDGTVSDADRATLDAGGGAGLCISEPAQGSIFPAAWTRPRFNFTGGAAPVKVVLTTARMRHPLTIYSDKVPTLIPPKAWEALSLSVYNEDITVQVTAGGQTGTSTFQLAPVAAGGSMVFWGSTGVTPGERTNALYGFGVGDEGVVRVLYPGDIQGTALDDNAQVRNRDQDEGPGKSTCIGCHSSSPDGGAVASMDHWAFNARVYSVEPGSAGAAPEWLTPAGAAMMSMTWLGQTVFSEGDWESGARRAITTWSNRDLASSPWKTHDGSVLSNEPTEILWMNLGSTATVPVDLRTVTPDAYMNDAQGLQNALAGMQGTEWGILPRTGDANSPVLPDWSHDGATIVYTSTDVPQDGRVGGATIVDLYTVPFNGGQGGAATPIAGANTADFEYYPDFSPDDALVAFNKLPQFTTNPTREDSFDHVYYRPDSNIHVIPTAGGTSTSLASNEPVCGGTAGQLYNSWAKWAPSTASDGQRTYYFLIFSTARNSPFDIARGNSRTSPASQLYMTTVIEEADGSITSGSGIYLWNQRNLVEGEGDAATVTDLGTNNVTPAWDEFKIPPVPPVIIR